MNNNVKLPSLILSPLFCVILSLCVFVTVWFLLTLETPLCFCWPLKRWGTALGVAGYYLFSFSLLLSSRWNKLEHWFGGLDRIYQLHRKLGIWGFCFILAHPWVEALKWLPHHVEKFILFTLPIHGRLSVNFGSFAYWFMLFILGITLLKLLPYDKWKILHKFMTLVFILASLHIVFSDKRVGSIYAQSLLYLPMGVGFIAIFYKQIYLAFLAKPLSLIVSKVTYINDNVVELALTPKKEPIKYIPGQYGFFSFQQSLLSSESHPFTMIESADRTKTSILIKARGDFTKDLYANIRKGDVANFEGPYGQFDQSQGGNSQIWIGAGIGIAPFLAWIRSSGAKTFHDKKIDFYYCVHRKADAVFSDDFREFSKSNSSFRFFLHCSEEGNRLDIAKIVETSGNLIGKQIFMCGPLSLTGSFNKEFQAHGVGKNDIFFENFEFI